MIRSWRLARPSSGTRTSGIRTIMVLSVLVVLSVVVGAACSKTESSTATTIADTGAPGSSVAAGTSPSPPPRPLSGFAVTSSAFGAGHPIPVKYSCKGENISPALAWTGVPKGTQMVALTMVDPDVSITGGFTHWVAYGIDPASGSLTEATKQTSAGMNGANKAGYLGPCPPAGAPHHYVFTLYALDKTVAFAVAPSRSEIEALGKEALATATLTGTFQTT